MRPQSALGSLWQRASHLAQLDRDSRVLNAAYRAAAEDVHRGEAVPPAAEWLLDNFHLISNEIVSVQNDFCRAVTTAGCLVLPVVSAADVRASSRGACADS